VITVTYTYCAITYAVDTRQISGVVLHSAHKAIDRRQVPTHQLAVAKPSAVAQHALPRRSRHGTWRAVWAIASARSAADHAAITALLREAPPGPAEHPLVGRSPTARPALSRQRAQGNGGAVGERSARPSRPLLTLERTAGRPGPPTRAATTGCM